MKSARRALASLLKSNKVSRKTLVVVLILIVLCLLMVLAGLIIYNHLESKAINDHPLVLIHTPENRQRVELGQEVSLHATARSQNGIARIELWADDTLIDAQDIPEDEILSPVVLHTYWEPLTAGPHTLVVQATSNSGVRGQATVVLYANESLAAGLEEDAASETVGETDPAEEETESGAEPAPGGPAPGPGGSPPGSDDDVRDLLDDDPSEPEDEPESSAEGGEPTALKVEILALETMESYEGLHCYVSFGEADDAPSQWYPDFDGDQATDDSFPSSNGRNWDVEPHLSGDAVPFITWPEDQPLGINTTCVGIADGGREAPELGQVNLIRRPETWDGITRRVLSEGGEGSYTIDYRISKEGGVSEEPVAKVIDPSMTSPTNLRVQNWANPFGEIVGQSLMWDYEPADDELPIDGFIIYLNGNLQWTESAERHFSDVPSQWFRPPCGEIYAFTVSAYRENPVTGYESYPSDELSFYTADVDDPVCEQVYLFSFNTMITGELHDGRLLDGMFGSFYVNDESVDFDGRCRDSGICGEVGLYENYTYDLHSTTSFLGNGPTQFLITEGDDHTLYYGYEVRSKYTTGIGATSTTQFCSNEGSIDWVNLEEMIDPIYEGTMGSIGPVRDFCQVSYTVEPLGGGPSVQPGQPLPLPLLAVEEITVDETGWLQIQIRNEGNADWTHAIPFSLSKNSGEPIGSYTWPSSTIAPGGRLTLEYDMSDEYQPMDVCVSLDPENEAPEQDDRFETPRQPHCHPLPDLSIYNVSFNHESESLTVIINNSGGTQEHTDVSLQLTIPGLELRPILHPNVTLGQYAVNRIEMPGITPELREAMMSGYSISVDSTNFIEETNEENNDYDVPPGARLQVHWFALHTHYYPYFENSDRTQEQRFHITVKVGPRDVASPKREIAVWSSGSIDVDREVQSGPWEGARLGQQQFNVDEWVEFTIGGDEYLFVSTNALMKYRSFDWQSIGGFDARVFTPEANWGVGRTMTDDRACYYIGMSYGTSMHRRTIEVQPPFPWQYCGNWKVSFFICQVE